MTLYFAYGSNLNRAAMARRCPGARAIGQATLEGYKFFVGVDGWGSVKRSAGDAVHGVLWRLTPRDIAALACLRTAAPGPLRRAPSAGAQRRAAPHGDDLSVAAARVRKTEAWLYRNDRSFRARLAIAARYIRSVERWSISRFTGARVIDAGELA